MGVMNKLLREEFTAFLNNPLNLQVLLSSISWQFQLHFLDLNQMTY